MRRAIIGVVITVSGCSGGQVPTDDPGVDPVDWACEATPTYVGDESWPWAVDVTETVTLCGTFDESRTLEAELAVKAQLQLAKGRYALPIDVEQAEMGLPACLVQQAGADGVASTTGTVRGANNTWEEHINYNATATQPLDGGGEISLRFYGGGTVGEPIVDLLIDGNPADPWGDSGFSAGWCKETGQEWCGGDRGTQFVVCDPTAFSLETHTLTFDGGQLVLHVRMGASAASTEPAAFVHASGTIDGTDFVQEDYWKLIYRPAHHHFSRDFAVLFDAPIDGACGLKVLRLDPWEGSETLPDLSLVDCALVDQETRTVTSNVWDRGD